MTKLERAEEILKDAEKAVVGVATAAATERDYDSASALLAVARDVNGLARRLRNPAGESVRQRITRLPHEAAAARFAVRAQGLKGGVPKRGTYPRFVRDADNLIKIAWSKTERSEYEHKSPKRVLSLLTQCLEKTAANGKRFAMESVMPITDPEHGSEIPPYQLYLCLAWLRQIGVVVQHGRQGYSVEGGENLTSIVESRWMEIPER